MHSETDQALSDWRARCQSVEQAINAVVLGQSTVVRQLMIAVLARGHVLLQGDVGVGKTTLLRAVARAIGGPLERVDGTVDLMPADLLYHSYVDPEGRPVVEPGPLLRHGDSLAVFFFNEINRARPQIHATLLRLMAERGALAFGQDYHFPHVQVFADRNQLEPEETYELPVAVRDRFLFELTMGFPSDEDTRLALLGDTRFHDTDALIASVPEALLDYRQLAQVAAAVQQHVSASPAVQRYALALCTATREPPAELANDGVPASELLLAGCSPRGMSWLLRAARVSAFLHGRDHVLPADVRELYQPAIAHRLVLQPAWAMQHERHVPPLLAAIAERVPAP